MLGKHVNRSVYKYNFIKKQKTKKTYNFVVCEWNIHEKIRESKSILIIKQIPC